MKKGQISVVIIACNEEANIGACIRSALAVSSDVIVVDSGSRDHTMAVAARSGARVCKMEWKGYGAARNFGASKSRHNWILALDADERITTALAASINGNIFKDGYIYKFRRANFIGDRMIRWGTPGFDKVARIYNRNYCSWDLSLVHEALTGNITAVEMLGGRVNHFGVKDFEDHRQKTNRYAGMSAQKYFLQGKRPGPLKKLVSSVFNSVKSYVFQLGFLDGRTGWHVARTIARYSWRKYAYLEQFNTGALVKEEGFGISRPIEKPVRKVFSSGI